MKLNLLGNRLPLMMLMLTAATFSSFGQRNETALKVVEDVFVSQAEPGTNFNPVTDMGVAIDETNFDGRETYLKFDLTDLVGKGGLVSVNLSIAASVKNEAPWTPIPNFDILVYGCTTPWSENTITWDTRVEADDEIIGEKGIGQFDRYLINGTEADTTRLKAYIENAMKNHEQYVSFVVKGKRETAGSRIWISDMTWEVAKLMVVQDYGIEEPGGINVYVSDINLKSAENTSEIIVDNGTLTMEAEVLPKNADIDRIKWSVINGTGRATISSTGVLKAISNGTVTVIADALDGSWVKGMIDITISNQKYTFDERNIIVDGTFSLDDPEWYGGHEIVDGICAITSDRVYPNCWDYAFNQKLKVPYDKKDLDYIFSFKAWSDEVRTFNVDMEDFNNGYARYGISTDGQSNGTSDWTFDLTTVPTVYVFHVNFANMLVDCSQNMKFNIGLSTATVYLDSVLLMTVADYNSLGDVSNAAHQPANYMKVYPNPVGPENMLTVSLRKSNEKVTIYNSLGQKMIETLVSGTVAKLDVSSLGKGMYFIRLSDGTSHKFIK